MNAPVQPKPPASPPASRMRLDQLVRGRQKEPRRTFLFGPEGVGKSTFGADAPKPIFLCAESGTAQLDVTRFPAPHTFDDCFAAVRLLTKEKHDFQTLVVDTVDWLEPLIWDSICKRDGKTDIEAYGYGKGYQAALDEWRRFLAELEQLRGAGVEVLMLGHAQLKTFKNPLGPDYDRYELKLNQKAGGLLKEWCDAVLFANWETYALKREDEKKGVFAKGKGLSTGARLVYTQRTAAYDAKNRYGLPAEFPLSWAEYERGCAAGAPASAEDLVKAIRASAEKLDEKTKKEALGALERVGGDVSKLAQLQNWATAKAAEQAGKES
jgi:hypothetical protein